jgi:4-oxalocrotonate tautomerase
VRDAFGAHDPRHSNLFDKEDGMALIQVTVIEGLFTAPQKREIVERLTDAMVSIEGESMRKHILCLVADVASGDWGSGGQTLTADDVRALSRSEAGDRL